MPKKVLYIAWRTDTKVNQGIQNQEDLRRKTQSLASIYPSEEHFDHRSENPWGDNGKLTKLVSYFLETKEAEARASWNEGPTTSIVCVDSGNHLSLETFLKQEEIHLKKRYNSLAQRKSKLISCYAPDILDDEAYTQITRLTQTGTLLSDENRYKRDRREITYLTHYSNMRDPKFTMHSWMMARKKKIQPFDCMSYENNIYSHEPAGFYTSIAAFIWQVERLDLIDLIQ